MTSLTGLISEAGDGAYDELRGSLIEGIIEESEDETLMDRYLGGEEISSEVLIDDLETAVARATFFPVVPVCSQTGVGLRGAARPRGRRLPVAVRAPVAGRLHSRRRGRRRDRVRPARACSWPRS